MLRISGKTMLAVVVVVILGVVLARHLSNPVPPHQVQSGTEVSTSPTNDPAADSDRAGGVASPSVLTEDSPRPVEDEGDAQSRPPADAPSAADIARAKTVAAFYVENLLTYGYPDRDVTDFVTRAAPYMTAELAASWRATSADTTDGGGEWARLTDEHLRHVTVVDDTVVTRWGGRSKLSVTTVFQAGDVHPGRSLSGGETSREATVVVVRTPAGWRAGGHTMAEARLS